VWTAREVGLSRPVLGALDDVGPRADHLDTVFRQGSGSFERQSGVERGLAAHGRQEGVRPFLRYDTLDGLRRDRLDIGGVGDLGVGHDRRWVGIYQDDAIALGSQCFARLHPGIVELAGLADHDRPGADDQDALEVGAFGQGVDFRANRRPRSAARPSC